MHIITRFGIPKRLISDNGTLFINKGMKNLTKAYYIKHGRSTPYYPQGNGQAEAINRVMLKILKKMKYEYRGKWSDHLKNVLTSYISSVKAATIQEKWQKCQLSMDKEESNAVFVTEDWRTPFMEYLA